MIGGINCEAPLNFRILALYKLFIIIIIIIIIIVLQAQAKQIWVLLFVAVLRKCLPVTYI